jgi:hypothetical protein
LALRHSNYLSLSCVKEYGLNEVRPCCNLSVNLYAEGYYLFNFILQTHINTNI